MCMTRPARRRILTSVLSIKTEEEGTRSAKQPCWKLKQILGKAFSAGTNLKEKRMSVVSFQDDSKSVSNVPFSFLYKWRCLQIWISAGSILGREMVCVNRHTSGSHCRRWVESTHSCQVPVLPAVFEDTEAWFWLSFVFCIY